MILSQVIQPKTVTIKRRHNQGFGFTLRHFIAYPPEPWTETSDSYQRKAMETIFIKEVHPNGPAYAAGLKTGDRILMVNNTSVAGISYSTIVSMIKQTPSVLKLQVVPKECDILQMYYTDIAHNPETNRPTIDIDRPLMPITSTTTPNNPFHSRLISYSPEGCPTISTVHQPITSLQKSIHSFGSDDYLLDECQLRPKQNLSVLQKPNNDEFMVRLRRSIEQKEEFLKSPAPNNNNNINNNNITKSSFESHNPHPHEIQRSSSPLILSTTASVLNKNLTVNNFTSLSSSNTTKKENDCFVALNAFGSSSISSSNSSNNDNSISKNIGGKSGGASSLSTATSTTGSQTTTAGFYRNSNNQLILTKSNSKLIQRRLSNNSPTVSSTGGSSDTASGTLLLINDDLLHNSPTIPGSGNNKFTTSNENSLVSSSLSKSSRINFSNHHHISSVTVNSTMPVKDKFHKELELLTDTGVTNQVFERKLGSNANNSISINQFDPFKQLSINTNIEKTSSSLSKSNSNGPEEKTIIKIEGRQNEYDEIYQYQQERKKHLSKQIVEIKEADQNLAENSESNDEFQMVANQKPYSEVVRRIKTRNIGDENKPMRRISYLRATNNEIGDFTIDVTGDNLSNLKKNHFDNIDGGSKSESELDTGSSGHIINKRQVVSTCSASVQTETIEKCEIEKGVSDINLGLMNGKSDATLMTDYFEADMEVKSSCIFGKRIGDYKSWRHVKVQLSGDILKINLLRGSKSENNVIELNVKHYNVMDETVDKKKFVFRLQSKFSFNNGTDIRQQAQEHPAGLITTTNFNTETPITTVNSTHLLSGVGNNNENTEILFKTKNANDMKKIFTLLQEKCQSPMDQMRQLAEPQKTVASSTISTFCEETSTATTSTITTNSITTKEYSPLMNSKSCVASVGLGNGILDSELTTDSISPVLKPRKSHSKVLSEKELGSPKSKNWKDLLFRRIHNSGNSDISSSSANSGGLSPKYVGSIGVPIKLCPMSKDNEFVPMIMDVCTKIVESKGLSVVGIYRIPGNKAAISELKEAVNKSDFQWDSIETDPRWEDVNVVSSLLKLFIRSLPDTLLPGNSYINFIEADKKGGERRLKELYYLLKTLPLNSYETLKHIIRHLHRVSKNCDVNLMEPKNLAIIFGPSIIRLPNETLDMAVKDMKHQCRIVEQLVSQYEYFFEDGELPELATSPQILTMSTYSDQTSLLLDNVSKIEQRLQHDKESLTSRFIPHLRRRTHSKRSAIGSDTYSGESVLSLESKKFSEVSLKESITHSSSSSNASKKAERSSVEISILLTDEDSSNSRLSDTGSMSLTTITDALDSKLRNLRSGSESTDETSENSPNKTTSTNRRQFPQPLILNENIPFADESPERHLIAGKGFTITATATTTTTSSKDTGGGGGGGSNVGGGTIPLKNLPISARSSNLIRDIKIQQKTNTNSPRFSSVYESCSDDSEVSTTSDPKEANIVISPLLFSERYKKRRDYRLFRSASFNCRNYSSSGGRGGGSGNSGNGNSSNNNNNSSNITNNSLTKDEKTDMNLTKKRQIQNKQNRSIKRRHTVGGPHDYATTTITRRNLNSNENQILEVGIRIKNVNRRN